MADSPTLQIPKDVIEPIIQAHVTTAVATALGGHKALIEQAVAHALNVKVNSSGNLSNYSYENTLPWLQWAMGDVIRKAARSAVEEEIGKAHEVIRKQIAAELRNSKSPVYKRLLESMTEAITKAAADKYRLTVSINGEA